MHQLHSCRGEEDALIETLAVHISYFQSRNCCAIASCTNTWQLPIELWSKALKCPSEHRTPNDLIRRNRSLQRFRVDSLGQFCCCQGMADPVPIVRTFMSSPEVTCSWTCLKVFKNDVPSRSAGNRARAEMRLDAAGDPGFEKNATKIPSSSESTRSGDHNDRLQEFTWTIGRHHRGGQGVKTRHSGATRRPPHLGVAAIGAVGALSTGQ